MATPSISSISTSPASFCKAHIDLESEDPIGIRTVPELIEYNAVHNPHHLFCLQAQKQAQETGPQLHPISHLELKRAISQCQASLLDSIEELKSPSNNEDGTVSKGPLVALYLESDVGLLIYLYALLGLGVPVLLLSARLSPTAIQHLLAATDACAMVASPRLKRTAQDALDHSSKEDFRPQLYTQAAFTSFLGLSNGPGAEDASICWPGHYIHEKDRNVLILHSSGTTGLPKPIEQSHKWLLGFTSCHEFSVEEATSLSLSTLPLYHGYGLTTPALSLGIGKTMCIPAPSTVPTGNSILELLRLSKAQSLVSVPSIFEEISQVQEGQGVEALASLEFIAFGGGLLKAQVGGKLSAAGVKILNHYGSTESGPIAPFFIPKSDYDWRYFRLRKDMTMSIEPANVLEDGTQSYTLITHPFGWEAPFIFQDQLISDPKNPKSAFSAIGRNDDLIVLANGEKVTPRILETILSENTLVNVAIAFGDGQFELGVLVQPSAALEEKDHDDFKAAIWPLIVQAGELMDAHARISSKDAIVLVPSKVIIPRSDKGSVMRKEVYTKFQAEIAMAYHTLDNNASNSIVAPLDVDHLERDLKAMIQDRLTRRLKPDEWTTTDDIFELGMDSLQAVQLRRLILSSIQQSTVLSAKAEQLPFDIIYQNPTVAQLAKAIRASSDLSHANATVDDYVQQFSAVTSDPGLEMKSGAVVLMTGGTGSLGSHTLAHLASLPSVARIICLNRLSQTPDASARQSEALKSRNIAIDPTAWSKIEILQTNTALPFLGLTETEYLRIQGQVSHVLHTAWPMDFKRKLPSFKAQFQVIQNLVHMVRGARGIGHAVRPKLLFVSSIAVVGQYPLFTKETIVPEISMSDERYTNDIGYAKAKLVCEKILEKAALEFGAEIDIVIVRVGQMSGSARSGHWNADEHMAALLKSSQAIGRLPSLQGTLSWLPVDTTAQVLSELLLSKSTKKVFYHLENPIRQSWKDVLNILATPLGLSDHSYLPFADWLESVGAVSSELSEELPVKALEEFFKTDFQHMACGNIVLDTTNTRDTSSTLRLSYGIDTQVLESYIHRWKQIGYLV